MKIDLVIAEDFLLTLAEVNASLAVAADKCGLDGAGLELHAAQLTQVVCADTLQKVCDAVRVASPWPRIVIVDLGLCGAPGGTLLPATAAEMHNAVVPEALRVSSLVDQTKAGGYLIAWHALCSRSPRQLILFATNQASVGPIHDRMEKMRTASGITGRYEILDGGLDTPDVKRRSRYIVQAVKEWLAAFGNPRSRLCPAHAETWFKAGAVPVPHEWAEALESVSYRRVVCEYLASVAQVDDDSVFAKWDKLPNDEKKMLHEFLKRCVGAHSCAYRGIGRRLCWKHMPFLAAACVPPPGSWPFQDKVSFDVEGENDLAGDGADEIHLLDLLVGDDKGTTKGLLPLLLRDKTNPKKNLLESCVVGPDHCVIKVAFDISQRSGLRASLFENFSSSVRQAHAIGGDVSVALFKIHEFLARQGGAVSLDVSANTIRCERPAS